MIEILVYLFENYLPEACPAPDALARKLSAAGFEQDEISEALDWLAGLDRRDSAVVRLRSQSEALRLYDAQEMARLPLECRGFLLFLEQAGTLDAETREAVIERALALTDGEVSLSKLKVIVLTVMWRHQQEFDALVLEELLTEGEEEEDGEARLCH
ncbi:hypothetical protein B9N43_13385 [Denitratisoma sp. DHT3]|uniref:DUF494 family protein n=1 Tax=Denitratisoma sp. DHT3 TaxID=1981880 RepID=UPI0011983020|nr:DUF494 domain-containing protein [Denitratisoma sp. DHT3]QDX82147.1 hypothetical protein B9N43_13385 [Denitratisoma sp. DHT3]